MRYGKYKVTLSIIGISEGKQEEIDIAEHFSREYWDALSQKGQEGLINDISDQIVTDHVEIDWEEID